MLTKKSHKLQILRFRFFRPSEPALLDIDYLVLSHGHLDHVWGLDALLRMYSEASIEGREVGKPFSKIRVDGQDIDDFMEDEIAIAYKSKDGLVVSNSCSHRGICNTIEYAKDICQESRIADVICGFHLQNPDEQVLEGTVRYFARNSPASLHPCHCTDLRSKVALSKVANLQEVGSGLLLEYA